MFFSKNFILHLLLSMYPFDHIGELCPSPKHDCSVPEGYGKSGRLCKAQRLGRALGKEGHQERGGSACQMVHRRHLLPVQRGLGPGNQHLHARRRLVPQLCPFLHWNKVTLCAHRLKASETILSFFQVVLPHRRFHCCENTGQGNIGWVTCPWLVPPFV